MVSEVRGGRRRQADRVAASAQALIDAALELIAEKGFERTTAGEIGERAGYSRSMVRLRYGSKDALLEELFRSEWETRLLAAPPGGANGLGCILAQIDHLSGILEYEPQVFRAFIVLSFEVPAHAPAIKPWHREWHTRYERQMTKYLLAGQKDGSIRHDLDFGYEVEHFIAYGTGLCFRWSLDWDGYDMAAALRRWREVLKRYLAP